MAPYGFIYITTNNLNGKRYLGMCAYHRPNHKAYLGSGKALRRVIRKYGSEHFSQNQMGEVEIGQNEEGPGISLAYREGVYPGWYKGGRRGGFGSKGSISSHYSSWKLRISEGFASILASRVIL